MFECHIEDFGMCQRATVRLKFCEMLGQCDSAELVACGKFDYGNVLIYLQKVVMYLCFFWPSKVEYIRSSERDLNWL